MALAHFQRTFTDTAGNVQAALSVTIRNESSGAIAAIFTDSAGGTPKANPFTTDSFGYGDFYAADGRYRIIATGIDWRNEEVITFENIAAAVQDAEDAAQAAALNAGIYADTTEGLANTVDGDYFSTPAAGAEEYLTLYRNDAGVATEIDTYPNKTAIDNVRIDLASNLATEGSDLVAHTGTSETVTDSLNSRVIKKDSIADMVAFDFSVGDFVSVETSGTGRPKNGRTLYRIMDLSTPVTNTVVDGAQIIFLNNGLYAVAYQTTSDGNIPFSLSRINMHFTALKGIPWNSSEAGGSSTYILSATVVPGDLTVTLNSVTDLVADQLICYKADSGLYHSAVIRSIAGNVLTLRTPIEATVTAGGNFHNFYVNSSHANPFGFYAITDYALKDLTHTYRKIAEIGHDQFVASTGNETLTLTTDEDIYAPGSSNNEYLRVTTSGVADEGVVCNGFYELPEGQYLVRAYVNPGSVNAGADPNDVQVIVSQTRNGFTDVVAQEQRTGHDCTRLYEFFYYAAKDTTQTVTIRSRLASAGEFEVAKVEILKVENTLTNLDNSKHVLLGDSWYAFGDIPDRIRDRLPNAHFFDEGLGGDRASDLVTRFSDASEKKPDYVWIMAGTNDYFGNITVRAFDLSMNILKEKIAEIGAIPIFFDPSVGEIDNLAEPQNFDRSRAYALQGSYSQSDSLLDPVTGVEVVEFFVDRVITAGSTNLVYMPPSTSIKSYKVIRSFFNSSIFNIQAGYRSSVGVPNENVETYAADTLVTTPSPIVVGPPAGSRFLTIAVENTSGGDSRALGYIQIEYTPA